MYGAPMGPYVRTVPMGYGGMYGGGMYGGGMYGRPYYGSGIGMGTRSGMGTGMALGGGLLGGVSSFLSRRNAVPFIPLQRSIRMTDPSCGTHFCATALARRLDVLGDWLDAGRDESDTQFLPLRTAKIVDDTRRFSVSRCAAAHHQYIR